MAKPRITGVGALGVTLTAEYVDSNRDVVRRVLNFLEDRRVLWRGEIGTGHIADVEQAEHCRISAEMIRNLLNLEVNNVRNGGAVEASFKLMRKAARDFCSAAGIDARNFSDQAYFNQMLEALRQTVGREVSALAHDFKIELDPDVKHALPPQDLGWLPGFGGDAQSNGQ